MQIIAHIPAREGSKRVHQKNLKLLLGKPLLQYSIEAAKASKLLTNFYVNTESEKIAAVARASGACVYKRPEHLADDHVTQDSFNYDFALNNECDIMVLINPVCPLITGSDIDEALKKFIDGNYDSLISVTRHQLHAFHEGKPLNFRTDETLPVSQGLSPVHVCNWAINIWKRSAFISEFDKKGHAVFIGNYTLHELPAKKAVKISEDEDFELAELLIRARNEKGP